ncbi:MAG: hypothetical protein PSW75_09010, partial [bacterium]|nr:hypothetical protein [bacterium]
MKTPSQRMVRLLGWVAALAGSSLVLAGEPDAASAVLSPGKRQEAVDQAKKLLAPREMAAITTDPFHPAGFEELVAASGRPAGSTTGTTSGETPTTQQTGPRNDHDLLVAIGAAHKPSGFF